MTAHIQNPAPKQKKMSGIYIHIPYCKKKCGYCSFYSVSDTSGIPLYLSALKKEIALRSGGNRVIADTVYIGGGTPSVLPQKGITEILNAVRDSFYIADDAEITVEANPESCSGQFIDECAGSGVNRLSLGLQSYDDKILSSIGRLHSAADFCDAVRRITAAGIKNISADVMTGLPGQSVKSVITTINKLLELYAVKHISLYGLTVEEGTPLYNSRFMADDDLEAQCYEAAVCLLEDNGFYRYEVSNFALPDFHSRHNTKYWTGGEYYGFGAGAHSFLITEKNDGSKVFERVENYDNVSLYNIGKTEKHREVISNNERVKEIIMLSLRTTDGLDLKKLKNETGKDLLKDKENEIEGLIKVNLLELSDSTLFVNKSAFYLLNTIILKLM